MTQNESGADLLAEWHLRENVDEVVIYKLRSAPPILHRVGSHCARNRTPEHIVLPRPVVEDLWSGERARREQGQPALIWFCGAPGCVAQRNRPA